jgi:hypothetical protein
MGLRMLGFSLVFSLLPIVACDESNTLVLDHPPATRVVIDSSRCPRVEKCGQCQLDFDAWDRNGQPAEFPTIVWTSLNPSAATVTATGRVNGWTVSPGVRIIAAVLETGAADTVNLAIVPPNGNITCTPPGILGAR